MPMTYPERRVSEATGIEQVAFCQSVLSRMFDDCGGLGHLSAEEFEAAALKAAHNLFPSAILNGDACAL